MFSCPWFPVASSTSSSKSSLSSWYLSGRLIVCLGHLVARASFSFLLPRLGWISPSPDVARGLFSCSPGLWLRYVSIIRMITIFFLIFPSVDRPFRNFHLWHPVKHLLSPLDDGWVASPFLDFLRFGIVSRGELIVFVLFQEHFISCHYLTWLGPVFVICSKLQFVLLYLMVLSCSPPILVLFAVLQLRWLNL